MIPLSDIHQAHERIRPFIRQTYLERSAFFSRLVNGEIWFKSENLQHTGSFKVRGALNKLLYLSPAERKRPLIAASTGNHGAAVGYALAQTGGRGMVYVPENASPGKVANIARWGVDIHHHGQDGIEAEIIGRQTAAAEGVVFVSPYNDPEIIAGQGTIGLELHSQGEPADVVFVALGGGGLISGIGSAIKQLWPGCRLAACSPANSAVMIESLAAGKILDLPSRPTLSDGTAGGIEAGSITFELCQNLIDEAITVTEEEIAAAMRQYMAAEHRLIEGAAGVALAGLLKYPERLENKKAIVILCGGNIDLDTLKKVIGS